MPRDLDFRRKPSSNEQTRKTTSSRPLAVNQLPPTQSVPTNTGSVGKRQTQRRSTLPLLIAIIGLAAAAIGTYYWTTLPGSKTASSSPATPATTPQQPATTTDQKNVFQTNNEPVINVYQSGASAETISQIVNLLKEKNYKVENLGDSQFEYDKTYIWHRAEFTDEAKAIGALLSGRNISYKESQNAGLFDVLIYLGKQ